MRRLAALLFVLTSCSRRAAMEPFPGRAGSYIVNPGPSPTGLQCAMIVGPRHVTIWFSAEPNPETHAITCRSPFDQ